MAKKKHEHGPLYLHARRELELAGLSEPKGANDTSVFSTTLRLVDTLERGTKTEFQRNVVMDMFASLSNGAVITDITDDPSEWEQVEGLGDGVSVNKRWNKIFSKDGGKTWIRGDGSASGVSKHIEPIEEESSDANETKKDVQPDKS